MKEKLKTWCSTLICRGKLGALKGQRETRRSQRANPRNEIKRGGMDCQTPARIKRENATLSQVSASPAPVSTSLPPPSPPAIPIPSKRTSTLSLPQNFAFEAQWRFLPTKLSSTTRNNKVTLCNAPIKFSGTLLITTAL